MKTKSIREKLVQYLQIADDRKVKAIYMILEDDINTPANDWDEDLLEELENRRKNLMEGTAKTFTWEETKKAAIDRVKSTNQ